MSVLMTGPGHGGLLMSLTPCEGRVSVCAMGISQERLCEALLWGHFVLDTVFGLFRW